MPPAVAAANAAETVQQIDLVPTLALLLGHAIPFGSLGAVIPDLFAVSPATVAEALWWNVQQVAAAVHRYGLATGEAGDALAASVERLRQAWPRAHADEDGGDGSGSASTGAFVAHARSYLREVLAQARATWAEFHRPLMTAGIVLAGAAATAAVAGGRPARSVSAVRTVLAGLLVLAWAGHFASNSFVVAEGRTNVLLTATALLADAALARGGTRLRGLAAVAALAAVRASAHFELCREEQSACTVRVCFFPRRARRRGARLC